MSFRVLDVGAGASSGVRSLARGLHHSAEMRTLGTACILLLSSLLSALWACGPEDLPIEERSSELIGGAWLPDRPEIGLVRRRGASTDKGCTGTLVDDRYVFLASHCGNYQTDDVDVLWITDNETFTGTVELDTDRFFAYGPPGANGGINIGDDDFGFLRLTRPAPAYLTRLRLADRMPNPGEWVTAFGYGCQNRVYRSIAGFRQYWSYPYGVTQRSCFGDSGGPRTFGGAHSYGDIWGVISGYRANGDDVNALMGDAAHETLRALRRVGQSPLEASSNNYFMDDLLSESGVMPLLGDFSGDGKADLGLLNLSGAWSSIPVGNGDVVGNFGTGYAMPHYAGIFASSWAPRALHRLVGDFDGDGRDDILLAGGSTWGSVPVAFSRISAPLITNYPNADFASWSRRAGAQAVVGDFDGDGRDDVALTGPSTWGTVPVFFSNGNGTFRRTNYRSRSFAGWAAQSGVKAVAGDFDGDGAADIALVGRDAWSTIPIAYSLRNGQFWVQVRGDSKFPGWSAEAPEVVAGDFDGDGTEDLAALGIRNGRDIGFLFNTRTRTGAFERGIYPGGDFTRLPALAEASLSGDLDGDGREDIVIVGVQPSPRAGFAASMLMR